MTKLICLIVILLGTATAQTNIAIGPTVLQPNVKRMGMNISNSTYYDAGQMAKNLVFRNPGFEGEIYNSIIRCASGSATTCVSDSSSAWPTGFWNNATFEVFAGAAIGRAGVISNWDASSRTLTFSGSGTAPTTGDHLIVRMTVPGKATAGWWPTLSGGGAITTNFSDLPPGTTGLQTAAVSAPLANDSAILRALFDGNLGRSFILLNGIFRLSFKAKGIGGSKSIAVQFKRDGLATYLTQTVTLTDSWATYTLPLSIAEIASSLKGQNLDLSFTTVGQDAFLIDDVSLVPVNSDPANPTAFSDPVVNAIKTLNPGSLRLWALQLGDTLDNLIAGPFSRQRSGFIAWNTEQDDISWGLPEFLQLSQSVGAEPWFVVPSTFNTTDASNLIEYLAGSSSTPYGAKRAAQGFPNPWTSVFNKIHLEFGNEEWNSSFKGGSIEYPEIYGARAQTIFAAMRSNPAYDGTVLDLVLGGQAVSAGRNQSIQNHCNNNDSFAIAPYMMGTVDSFTTNEGLFGSTFAEGEAYVTLSGTAEGVANGMILQTQQALAASSHPVPLLLYEMNLSTLGGAISQTALNTYASSLGAGLGVANAMLQEMRVGVMVQNLWNLHQYNFLRPDGKSVWLWGAVVDMGVTNQRRPQYLALELANQAIGTGTAMVQTVHTGDNPTWNQPLVNTVQLTGAHYLQSFAFSSSTANSLIVFNLHRTLALPVTFTGANAPSGNVQLSTLTSANLTDTNEMSEVVFPTTSALTAFNPASALLLPPYSMTTLTWGAGITNTIPLITNVTVSVLTGTTATIAWTTDQPSTSQVKYGTTIGYGSVSANDLNLVTSHSVTLVGLTPGTTYDYSVVSNSANGTASSPNLFFMSPVIIPPTVVISLPVISALAASNVTNTSATISYLTTVLISGLPPNTPFSYVATSSNPTGTAMTKLTFATTPTPTTPIISNVVVSLLTINGATISWTTDQPSSSQVQYGTTTAYGTSSTLSSTLVTSHVVALFGLVSGTTYDFAVVSASASGTATSTNVFFSTLMGTGVPVLSNIIVVPGTNHTAIASWTSSIPTQSQVQFGPTTSYGHWSPQTTLTVTPSTSLGYVPSGLIHYRIRSNYTQGIVVSPDATFMEP